MARQVHALILLLASVLVMVTACAKAEPSTSAPEVPAVATPEPSPTPDQAPPQPPSLSQILSAIRNGVVAIRTPAGTGSGFIISE